jgi:hypothetical protein
VTPNEIQKPVDPAEPPFLASGEHDYDADWLEEEDDGEFGEAETSPAS